MTRTSGSAVRYSALARRVVDGTRRGRIGPPRRIPDKRVLIVRQPDEVVMRRCRNRAAARAELRDLPCRPGYRYEIRD